jgi:hypothetical protein
LNIPQDEDEEGKSDDNTAKLSSFHLRSEQGYNVDKEKVKKLERINKLKEEKALAGPGNRKGPAISGVAPPLRPLKPMGT